MQSDFAIENETAKSYNGRQILELLQNCDDQSAENVSIIVNYEQHKLEIRNDGPNPFSKDGYLSLSLTNVSSKRDKKKYIGNKGLGLRSIRAWSEHFQINSNGIRLDFSKEFTKESFNNLYDEQTQRIINNTFNRPEDSYLPFFSCPRITDDLNSNEYTTSVIIWFYDNELENVKNQLKQIDATLLLFLSHINSIKIIGDENKEYSIKRENHLITNNLESSYVVLNDGQKWRIFMREGEVPKAFLPKDEQAGFYYQVKLAYCNGEIKDYALRCYFPTRIVLHTPYILHATFDLNQNRNHITEPLASNKYIANQLSRLIVDAAKLLSSEEVSWKPLQMLQLKESQCEELRRLGFFENLKQAIEDDKFYPCIDDAYRDIYSILYISDSFASHMLRYKNYKEFNEFLMPGGNELVPETSKRLGQLDIQNKVHILSQYVSDTIHRAEFIYDLASVGIDGNFTELLTDTNGNPVSIDEIVFSPSNKIISTPGFCHISFINSSLYINLLNLFNISDEHKPRALKERLKKNFNFESYEPSPLCSKIISECNKHKESFNYRSYLSQTLKCLYDNFSNGVFTNDTRLPELYLITKNNEVKGATKLHLSSDYPTGKNVSLIFNGIYEDSDYLADRNCFGLDEEDPISVEKFFIMLNVNTYCHYIDETNEEELRLYYVHSQVSEWKRITCSHLTTIEGIEEILDNIRIECLIALVAKDSTLQEELKKKDVHFSGKESYYKKDKWDGESFLLYKFKQSQKFNFSYYTTEEPYHRLYEKSINFASSFFSSLNITPYQIKEAFLLLGAKREICELKTEDIATLINRFNLYWKDGEGTQTIYKNLCNELSAHNINLSKESYSVFASKNGKLGFYPHQEVWFNDDNIELPVQIRNQYPIFNYPKRQKGITAITIFGLNNIKDIAISLEGMPTISPYQQQFEQWFDSLKPCILAARFNEVSDSKQRNTLSKIVSELRIVICDSAQYSASGKVYELCNYEYIRGDSKYVWYLKYPGQSTSFCNNPTLIEHLAELLSSIFNLTDDSVFELLLSKNDASVAKVWVQNRFGYETYTDANKYLGRCIDPRMDFCQSISAICGVEYDDTSFIRMDGSRIDYGNLNIDFSSLKSALNIEPLQKLFSLLNCTISQFNKQSTNRIEYSEVHEKTIRQYFSERLDTFRELLWNALSSTTNKGSYLSKISEFENYLDIRKPYEKYSEHFHIDCEKIWNKAVGEVLGTDIIDNKYPSEIPSFNEWESNLKQFTLQECALIMESSELKSLLYFPDGVENVKTILNENFLNNNSLPAQEVGTMEAAEIVDTEFIEQPLKDSYHISIHPYTPSTRKERSKKKAGDDAEQAVFLALISKYGESNVVFRSKEDEGSHYDIRYTKDKRTKYVEVKNISNGYFEISRDEVLFGRKHWEDYEVWLYRDGKVTPIKDFFNEKGECKFQLDYAKSYIVVLRESC